MYLRNSKSFIPTQAVPIPRGRPQGHPGALKSPGGAPGGAQGRPNPPGAPSGDLRPPGVPEFCQVVQSGLIRYLEARHFRI